MILWDPPCTLDKYVNNYIHDAAEYLCENVVEKKVSPALDEKINMKSEHSGGFTCPVARTRRHPTHKFHVRIKQTKYRSVNRQNDLHQLQHHLQHLTLSKGLKKRIFQMPDYSF